MKATELMVGDWVKLDFYDNAYADKEDAVWKNGKITAIHHGNWVDADFGGPLDECDIEVSAVQPIPLTPEILEKNGFKFDGSGQCSMMFLSKPQFAEGLRFNIYVGLKRKTIEVFAAHPIEKSPNWRKSNKVYLEVCGCYVHDLQHALRLCGIEKEITL